MTRKELLLLAVIKSLKSKLQRTKDRIRELEHEIQTSQELEKER